MHKFNRRSSKLALFDENDSFFLSLQNHSQCFHSAVISGIFVELSKVENFMLAFVIKEWLVTEFDFFPIIVVFFIFFTYF